MTGQQRRLNEKLRHQRKDIKTEQGASSKGKKG